MIRTLCSPPAHAGSRAQVTSMGGLYDAATLHAHPCYSYREIWIVCNRNERRAAGWSLQKYAGTDAKMSVAVCNAASKDPARDFKIMKPTRCQLRYSRLILKRTEHHLSKSGWVAAGSVDGGSDGGNLSPGFGCFVPARAARPRAQPLRQAAVRSRASRFCWRALPRSLCQRGAREAERPRQASAAESRAETRSGEATANASRAASAQRAV